MNLFLYRFCHPKCFDLLLFVFVLLMLRENGVFAETRILLFGIVMIHILRIFLLSQMQQLEGYGLSQQRSVYLARLDFTLAFDNFRWNLSFYTVVFGGAYVFTQLVSEAKSYHEIEFISLYGCVSVASVILSWVFHLKYALWSVSKVRLAQLLGASEISSRVFNKIVDDIYRRGLMCDDEA